MDTMDTMDLQYVLTLSTTTSSGFAPNSTLWLCQKSDRVVRMQCSNLLFNLEILLFGHAIAPFSESLSVFMVLLIGWIP